MNVPVSRGRTGENEASGLAVTKGVAAHAVHSVILRAVLRARDRPGGSHFQSDPCRGSNQFNSLWYLKLAQTSDEVSDERIHRFGILLVDAMTSRETENGRPIQSFRGLACVSYKTIRLTKNHHARDRQ